MRLKAVAGLIYVGVALGIVIGLFEAVLIIAANRYIQYGMFGLAAHIVRSSLNSNLMIFAGCSGLVFLFWLVLARGAKPDEAKYVRAGLLVLLIVLAVRILTWSSLPLDMLPLALKRALRGLIGVLKGIYSLGEFLSLFRRYIDALIILAGGAVALIVVWKVSARFRLDRLTEVFAGKRGQVWAIALVVIWLGVNIAVGIDQWINAPSGPNVILIGIDTLRADHVGCYEYDRDTTPHIDSLAKNAVVFKKAFSTSSWTLPSFHSIMTSLYQISHGVIDVHHRLDDSYLTLAEVLKNAGYKTAGFISGPLVKSLYGFNQGFDVYDESSSSPGHLGSESMITSPNLVRLASNWLNENKARAFFLFIHWWDPHCDYIPPSPYDRTFDPYYEGTMDGTDMTYSDKVEPGMEARDLEHIVALYDGEICWTDWHLGKLFDTLENLQIYDNTIVVIVADHGEEFLEHGGKLHARTLYDEVIRVPLVFRIPGISDPQEIEEVVSVVDITPTVLDILDIDHPASLDGESLLPIIVGTRKGRMTREVYSELQLTHDLASLISGRWKLVQHLRSRDYELYNTDSDRGEQNNLIEEAPEQATALSRKLARWLDAKRSQSVAAPAAARDAGTTRELKALGYIQ